jgi:membrane associated rhomboid family serine protease
MTVIVICTAIVWLIEMIVPQSSGVDISKWLEFDKAAILQGEVWRVITFLFIPNAGSLFTLALSLYFYWWIGSSLENVWGSFRFDAYYLCGVVGAIVGGFITGYATNEYLNMSLFLAFAILFPEERVLLFFFIPVKMKWLGIIDAVLIALELITYISLGAWSVVLLIVLSLFNLLLFVWRIPIDKFKAWRRRRKWQKEARRPNEDNYPFDL